jgi:hypothetical protein
MRFTFSKCLAVIALAASVGMPIPVTAQDLLLPATTKDTTVAVPACPTVTQTKCMPVTIPATQTEHTIVTTTISSPSGVRKPMRRRAHRKHIVAHKRRTLAHRTIVKRVVVTKPVYINRTITKIIEKPVLVERPAVIEQTTVQSPTLIERCIERPVVIDQVIRQPILEVPDPQPVIIRKRPKALIDLNIF